MPVLSTVEVQLSLHKCNIAKAAPEAREGQLPRNRQLTTNKPRSKTGSAGLSIWECIPWTARIVAYRSQSAWTARCCSSFRCHGAVVDNRGSCASAAFLQQFVQSGSPRQVGLPHIKPFVQFQSLSLQLLTPLLCIGSVASRLDA